MGRITVQTQKEIIKSAAYGYTPKKISEVYGITVDKAKDILASNKSEIDAQKKYLKGVGK
jgi:DNA-binding CsgD family transcriptional regulator